MDTEAQTHVDTEEVPSAGKLLSAQERLVFEQLASGDAPHTPWARALLAIDEGASRAEAAQRAGMTSRQVRYWLAKYRKLGSGIFPRQALDAAADELVALTTPAQEGEGQVGAVTREAGEELEAATLEASVEELKPEKKVKKPKEQKKKKKDKKGKGKGKKKGGKKGKSRKDKSSKKSKKDGKKKSKKAKR